MALNETQEALLEGASALRYKAEQLAGLATTFNDSVFVQVKLWREQADLLDRLGATGIGN